MNRIPSWPVGWIRLLLATLFVACMLLVAGPASAQDEPEPEPTGVTVLDGGEGAQPESGIVRDEDTSATVQRIRRDLLLVAGFTAVGLVVYVWHTNPTRRVRVAAERAETVLGSDDD